MFDKLKKEFEFYEKNKNSLVMKYNGQYIAIVNSKVICSYPSQEEVIKDMQSKNYGLGTFLVQLVSSYDNVQKFYSRVYV